ncbi:hypothetical protein HC723_16645 [Vibrio sp. S11_S32]|uniref:hypothetical protein n=1 Tax=Vibrio sp. S11_S32 TaxID=2720225 RepID=UPI00167FE59E|nr:hypothetical protein [Vibrio sp. S11_S32]MBD1578016.1 hypothetical protein [Vibrio sp. S11_S32]
MMETIVLVIEKSFLFVGISLILMSMVQYGKRSQDWKGLATIFYKRVEMSVGEFKYYKLGVSLVVFAVVLRILCLTLWP